MSEVERNVTAQIEVYGEPLDAIFSRVTQGLGLTRGGLATVLGMSPPMLSQLGSGHRVKIGNPAVQRRLEEVQLLLDQVSRGEVPADGIPELLSAIQESTGAWTSATTRTELHADASHRALREVATPEELGAAADLLEPSHPRLAGLLREAAQR